MTFRAVRFVGLLAILVLAGLGAVPSNAYAAFPGANGKLAFCSNRDGNFEIYTMNADGSAQTRLTNNLGDDSFPAWSPDGTTLAFMSNRDGNLEIYTMNADGSGERRLTSNLLDDRLPGWSPDGTKIAFDRVDGDIDVWSMNADGSAQTRLTTEIAFGPVWSPDANKIVFSSYRDGFNFEVYSMNADGSAQTRLTTTAGADADPDWSPDGSQITFRSHRDGNGEIYSMNADGSAQTRLTNDPAKNMYPSWSPDGTKIAFQSDGAGAGEIYSMNADGSAQTRLTIGAAAGDGTDWQPIVAIGSGGGAANGGSSATSSAPASTPTAPTFAATQATCAMRATTTKLFVRYTTRVGVRVLCGNSARAGVKVTLSAIRGIRRKTLTTDRFGFVLFSFVARSRKTTARISAPGMPSLILRATLRHTSVAAFSGLGTRVRRSARSNCRGITFKPRQLVSGATTRVSVQVNYRRKPVANALVLVRGGDVRATRTTARRGSVRFRLAPRAAGRLRLSVPNVSSCVKRLAVAS